jgi:membrane protein implicated in regulation of membrane protease activity
MLIYAAVSAFGLLLLLVMLAVGEIFGDHDVSHDAAAGSLDADGGGPSVFSLRIMAAFLTAFGVGGIVARYYGASHVVASGTGVVAGLAMATLVLQFAKALYAQQASTDLTMRGLVGQYGEVSVAIPMAGVGQVTISAGGERSEHLARSADGGSIARGTPVQIMGVTGDGVLVEPARSVVAGGVR